MFHIKLCTLGWSSVWTTSTLINKIPAGIHINTDIINNPALSLEKHLVENLLRSAETVRHVEKWSSKLKLLEADMWE